MNIRSTERFKVELDNVRDHYKDCGMEDLFDLEGIAESNLEIIDRNEWHTSLREKYKA